MKIIFKLITIYFNTLSWFNPQASAKQAFNLFAYPFKAKLKPNQQLFLKSAVQFKLEVNNKKLQCYKWGSGLEKILFVHGWQSHSYRWRSFIESIDLDRYTIYAFDAPGHGNSEGKICNVPLYEKSIEALIHKVGYIPHFVGHSIGSFACASFMFHHDYKVQSYCSLASPLDANEFLADFTSKIKLSPRAISYLSEYFKLYTSHPIKHYSQEKFAATIDPEKILIIHDKEDKSTPYTNAQKMFSRYKTRNKDVAIHLTEGLGHSLRSDDIVAKVYHQINS